MVLGADFACAQAPTPQDVNRALQQQKQILQQREERRREDLRDLRKTLTPPNVVEKEDPSFRDRSKNCARVKKMRFEGADLLGEDVKAAIEEPYRNACMTIIDIMSVVRVVTNWYINKGYVTTRCYPPEQDLSRGILTIKVIEGRTESVEIKEDGKPRRGADNAFPRMVGKRLYIRDIEQGIDQINRLPSQDARIRIEPGGKDGYSTIKVDTAKKRFPLVRSSINNHGLTSTGELQASTTVYVDDVLGLYDAWSFSYKDSDEFYSGPQRSNELSASVSIPWGYWTLLASFSSFDYLTTIHGLNQQFKSDGGSRYYTVELDYVFHRDQVSKSRISAFLNFKDTENFVEDIRLTSGSRKLNVIGTRLSHTRRALGGVLDVSVAGDFGAPMFGSLRDEDSLPGSPSAEFSKISGNFSFYRPFKLGELPVAWSVQGYGQRSSQDLYNTEQVSLGGLYTVRGFRNESIAGDGGAYVRNELIVTLPYVLAARTKWIFGDLDLVAALDAGWLVNDAEDDAFEHGSMKGGAAGVRLHGGLLYGEAFWEKAFEAPSFIEEEDSIFRFQAGVALQW